MNADVIIGIDAGTSVMMAVAFSTDGQQLAIAAIPNHYVTLPGGVVEQDMNRTWVDAAATVKQLCDMVSNLASRRIAISVTAQGDGLWLISTESEPVGLATIWLGSRAALIVEQYVSTRAHASHYARTGTGLTVVQMSGKLAWMQRHKPDVLAKASYAFHCKDRIFLKLTGDRVTDPSEADFTLGNYRSRTCRLDILDDLGLGNAKTLLPPLVDGTLELSKESFIPWANPRHLINDARA